MKNPTQDTQQVEDAANIGMEPMTQVKAHHSLAVVLIVVLAVIIIVGAAWFLMMRPAEVVAPEVPEAPAPVVYSEEELRAAMETPLPPEMVETYSMEELREAMDTPLSEDAVVQYSDEELRAAMEVR
jgi:flagellar basal body-associated protein FliL